MDPSSDLGYRHLNGPTRSPSFRSCSLFALPSACSNFPSQSLRKIRWPHSFPWVLPNIGYGSQEFCLI